MKQAIIEQILKFIRREAEKGGGRPSLKGLFEQEVPQSLTTYIGAKGTHYVFCGDVPWGPKESSIGVQ